MNFLKTKQPSLDVDITYCTFPRFRNVKFHIIVSLVPFLLMALKFIIKSELKG